MTAAEGKCSLSRYAIQALAVVERFASQRPGRPAGA
jgi:hypothetical protein